MTTKKGDSKHYLLDLFNYFRANKNNKNFGFIFNIEN